MSVRWSIQKLIFLSNPAPRTKWCMWNLSTLFNRFPLCSSLSLCRSFPCCLRLQALNVKWKTLHSIASGPPPKLNPSILQWFVYHVLFSSFMWHKSHLKHILHNIVHLPYKSNSNWLKKHAFILKQWGERGKPWSTNQHMHVILLSWFVPAQTFQALHNWIISPITLHAS